MAILALTNVYLDAEQKKALTKRAKLKGTNLSVEVRNAVDSYLAGVTVDELQMLDAATRQAGEHIDEMNAILDAGLKRSEAFFREIAALKGETTPPPAGPAPARARSTAPRAATVRSIKSAKKARG
jgi:hypothetical protein